jgi:amino acid adenylation domain-containing protein
MNIVEEQTNFDQECTAIDLDKEDKTRSIVEMFLNIVKSTPKAIAVSCNGHCLTYEEFYSRCLNVYSYLTSAGIAPDQCVGVYIDPSIEQLVAIWGVMMAGGAYLPLSTDYPFERINYIVKDSKCTLILTSDELKDGAERQFPRNVVIFSYEECVEYVNREGGSYSTINIAPVPMDSLAYVIYTSGSTGYPKGVMVEHHSVSNQVLWLNNECGLKQGAVILHKTPMSFDAAQCEILSLACGSHVVIGKRGVYREPLKLIESIRRDRVTILICVPTLLQALLDTGLLTECTSLQILYSGGEALHRDLASRFIDALPECNLINMYGPTECAINTSALHVNKEVISSSREIVSIGSPIYNTKYHILTEEGYEAKNGDVGELHISGSGLARGYLNRPDLTSEKFIENVFDEGHLHQYLYRTGDLCRLNADGTYQFVGRTDNQVKLRGYRIELDEIAASIETHNWVKRSALVVKGDDGTGYQNLIAFIELDPSEAALMDQGMHLAHHQSKESRIQVSEQISGHGHRDLTSVKKENVVSLPFAKAPEDMLNEIYSRKSYRFYEGGDLSLNDVLKLLSDTDAENGVSCVANLRFEDFGRVLRYFGANESSKRLLTKYAYASPGALYATQMYLEIDDLFGIKSGYYYYDPRSHALVLIMPKERSHNKKICIHFVGKRSAIESVYKNNILEVLEIEVGHMIGLFEKSLSRYSLYMSSGDFDSSVMDNLDVCADDFYLGTFSITGNPSEAIDDKYDIYIQSHGRGVGGLASAMYKYSDGRLNKISDEVILRKHVIAINQAVYERSSVGISIVSKTAKEWRGYIDLGRKLQKLQMNDFNIGLMSSGYSSKTGNDLPSAKFMKNKVDDSIGPFYFCVGGRVSNSQLLDRGMKEDSVHMKGPAEMLRDDLANRLPDYMLPNKIVVIKEMPLTVNGKVDVNALKDQDIAFDKREHVLPRSTTESKLVRLWCKHLNTEDVSIDDTFFELGGNSLIAVALVNDINLEFGINLPLQILFKYSRIETLAAKISQQNSVEETRLVPLKSDGDGSPIYCWPGLGGYCMNLRRLAEEYESDQPFWGVQACGINEGETPYATIEEMARADVETIRNKQPKGPYVLWGYSFGARVAFEAAYQLEQGGEEVAKLILIAPGSPKFNTAIDAEVNHARDFRNRAYVTVLCSVFTGGVDSDVISKCLESVSNREEFIDFIAQNVTALNREVIERIALVSMETFEFEYTFDEMNKRTINAPIAIIKASGDDYSFIEGSEKYLDLKPNVRNLSAGHYKILKEPGIHELVEALRDVGA